VFLCCAVVLRSWLRQNYWALLAALLFSVALTLPSYLVRHGHHPPVGTYIAIMGCLVSRV
jgi:hypothetical protein